MKTYSSTLPVTKQLALAALVVAATAGPVLVARPFASYDAEPAVMALFSGILVGLGGYLLVRILLPELDTRAATSTATVLGLIAAHVYVFRVAETLPSLPMLAFLVYLFFLHFDEHLTAMYTASLSAANEY